MEWLPSSAGLVVIALLCGWTAWAGAHDELPRNDLMGIRTRATKASDSAWYAGHRAAAPLMWATAVAALMCAVVAVVLAAMAGSDAAIGTVTILGYVLVTVLMLAAAAAASRAARGRIR